VKSEKYHAEGLTSSLTCGEGEVKNTMRKASHPASLVREGKVKSEKYHAEGLTSSLTCEGGGSK